MAIARDQMQNSIVDESKIDAATLLSTGGLQGGGGTKVSLKLVAANPGLQVDGNGLDVKRDGAGGLTSGALGLGIAATGVTNAMLAGGITDANLANGAEFLKRGGTVTMTADLPAGGFKITGLGAPTATGDAATKSYVDGLSQGLDVKNSVKAASTGNLTLSAAQTVDGIALVATDRVLVKDQTAPAENGIYAVAAGAWTRVADMDAWAEVPGAFVFVEQGTTNADSGWICTADAGGTLGTTAITWSQFSQAGVIQAGAGLTKTGTTIDVVGSGADDGLVIAADSVAIDWEATAGNYATVNAGDAAAVGTQGKAARSDHQHPVSTAAPSAGLDAASTNAEGVATSLARSDHAHAISAALVAAITSVDAGDAAVAGTNNAFARGDHQHAVTSGAAVGLDATSANAEGSGAALARAAHTHAVASAAPGTSGLATASSAGSSASFARADHLHQSNTSPVTLAETGAAAIGTSGEPPRADHVHALPDFGREGAALLVDNVRRRDSEIAFTYASTEGAVLGTGAECAVSQLATPGMAVRIVTGGVVYHLGGSADGKRTSLAAVASLTIAAADPTNPRYDVIVVQQSDGAAVVRQGTPGASPALPTLTAGDASLAVVKVAAGVTSILDASVFNHRRRVGRSPEQDSYTGTGAANQIKALAHRVSDNRRKGVVVYRNGLRIKFVTGAPASVDEYTVPASSSTSPQAVEQQGAPVVFGGSPATTDVFLIDYEY